MHWQAWLYAAAVAVPLLAALGQTLGTRWLGRRGAWLATGAIAVSLVLSLVGAVAYLVGAGGTPDSAAPLAWRGAFDWVNVGSTFGSGRSIPIAIEVDNLTVLMFAMVTSVATLVHFYSIAYLRDDPRRPAYFATLSLFSASMLGLVASANLFGVFVCWELVGVCSYLLIGFWREVPANTIAATKAFLVNRVGDVGLIVGLGLLWSAFGTLDLREINDSIRDDAGQLHVTKIDDSRFVSLVDPTTGREEVDPGSGLPRRIGYGMLVLAGLGIFAGCAGKSAQFPLHAWLPDAMAGPTPVSALIHAATMVAAGVYLVARAFPLFTPEVLLTVAYAGAITLLLGATMAVAQADYKKVLAYSTVSQLGFMMLALGVGGRSAGLFHLLTHASSKALLFLGAGVVFHATGTYELAKLGGLRQRMRITATTMLVATLAISGVPLLSGFASKDAILASTLRFALDHPTHAILFLIPVLGATLTPFYMVRLWFLMFAGTPRSGEATAAHEGERLLTWPLLILAVPTVVLGWSVTVVPLGIFEPVLLEILEYGEPIESVDVGSARWWAMGASVLLAALGLGLGALYYAPGDRFRKLDPRRTVDRLGWVAILLERKWYVDVIYQHVFVGPTLALARAAAWFDRWVIDGIVDGSAWLVERLSRWEGVFDHVAVDRLVGLVAAVVYTLGDRGRRLQTGRLPAYLLMLAIGVIGLFAGMYAWIIF